MFQRNVWDEAGLRCLQLNESEGCNERSGLQPKHAKLQRRAAASGARVEAVKVRNAAKRNEGVCDLCCLQHKGWQWTRLSGI